MSAEGGRVFPSPTSLVRWGGFSLGAPLPGLDLGERLGSSVVGGPAAWTRNPGGKGSEKHGAFRSAAAAVALGGGGRREGGPPSGLPVSRSCLSGTPAAAHL